ncbi:MAG: UPF0489 family protein [Agathobacter sp.]|nr:UPF0489 family protein [Agathobacter sp.]
MKVLDLDMDYFMTEIAHTPFSSEERLDEEDYGSSVWSVDKVRQFLERNLGLSKTHKIPGRIVSGHNQALFFWEELIESGKLREPFDVVHVDSHGDLGLGVPSGDFLQSMFLTLPIETRRKIRNYEFNGRIEEISIGDYLLWAIAYRMISSVTYCANPNGDKNDYLWDTLKNFQEEYIWDKPVKNYIQLKFNAEMEMPKYDSSEAYKKRYLAEAIKDPEVELLIIPTIEDVRFCGDFDYAVLAQSPNYTPKSADYIMDIFREYIEEV